jgi:hypothetical protein
MPADVPTGQSIYCFFNIVEYNLEDKNKNVHAIPLHQVLRLHLLHLLVPHLLRPASV